MVNTKQHKPVLSIVIATLNASKVIKDCLDAIFAQSFKNFEIIVADGGSVDNTISIAKKYQARVFDNPLKTAEAGKAVGLKHTRGQFVAFIDSDNILPDNLWFDQMLRPFFEDQSITCSEPISFTYRPTSGFIERYSSLLGANDPYAWFTGVYDRYSLLTDNWTGLKLEQVDHSQYIEVTLYTNRRLPTIGANGTIFRSNFLKKYFAGDYLFDIDVISVALKQLPSVKIAKVKNGIIHTYCESSISKFIRKQRRRVVDMYYYQSLRQYDWQQPASFLSLTISNLSFALYSLLIIPSLTDSIRGYLKKSDPAWFFHPLACLLSFLIYTQSTIINRLGFSQITNRQSWRQ